MRKPFAITLDVGSSRANHTGAWRTERPVYVHNLPPCNNACPAGENIQQWLYDAEEGPAKYEAACPPPTTSPVWVTGSPSRIRLRGRRHDALRHTEVPPAA